MSSQSQMLAMDFDGSKIPSYVDPVEFSYMDGGLDNYLQYLASTPSGLGRSCELIASLPNGLRLSNNISVYTESAALLDSLSAIIPPHSLAYSLSSGETSLDNTSRGRARPGSSVPYQATVPRSQQFNPMPARAATRKQRIESEKRRRGDLRDGRLARLKHTLLLTNEMLSNGSVLERATGHIRSLEASAEAEVHRLRNVSELMLGAASQRQQGAF
ncbi:hypothetical protein DFP72DRAFT_1107916 [Ephemerocybe angulata]|uniref:BHLH domain-containing protein n=1 Tax=Ephemerocybe angulata TaxID=980116 RepID=A0A8H6IJE6_9AGAR|nr:hypothetical protein DFP72DRAFT_1107916 [Tulosesus angulatus]